MLESLSDRIHSLSYEAWWHYIFSTLLNGFWCRFFAVTFLLLSIWFAFKRRNARASVIYFLVMLFFAYGATFFSAIKLL